MLSKVDYPRYGPYLDMGRLCYLKVFLGGGKNKRRT
jgi:hypothetical protein